MKTFRRIMLWLLAAGVVAFLAIPLYVPAKTSGVLTFREAAGVNSEFIEVGDLDVHVERFAYEGDCACAEPVIFLLHGFGASTFSWRDVVEPLRAEGTVIAYDRPAFGFTERPTQWQGENPYGDPGNQELLGGLIDKLAPGHPVILIGHSAGGALAANYALNHPGEVSGLILVDPAILTTGGVPAWLQPVLNIPQLDALGPLLVANISTSGQEVLRQSYVDQAMLTPEVMEGYQAPLHIAGWERAFWEFVKAPRSRGLAENVPKISTPTLLITGDADTIVPTADTQRLATMFPNASLVIVPRAGHLPHEEQPEEFMSAVTTWMMNQQFTNE